MLLKFRVVFLQEIVELAPNLYQKNRKSTHNHVSFCSTGFGLFKDNVLFARIYCDVSPGSHNQLVPAQVHGQLGVILHSWMGELEHPRPQRCTEKTHQDEETFPEVRGNFSPPNGTWLTASCKPSGFLLMCHISLL